MNRLIKNIILLHLLFWVLNFLKNFFFFDRYAPLEIVVDQVIIIFFFYWNYFFLVPAFFKRKKIWQYLIWFAILFFSFSVIYGLFEWYLFPDLSKDLTNQLLFSFGVAFHLSFTYVSLSTASRLAYDYMMNMKQTAILQQTKQKAQIESLQSYINIPFMLASLSLAEKQANESQEKTQSTILKLSNVLKHNLYGQNIRNQNGELEVVQDFITLLCQQNDLDFELNTAGNNIIIAFKNTQNSSLFLSSLEKNVNLPLQHYTSISENSISINISKFNNHD